MSIGGEYWILKAERGCGLDGYFLLTLCDSIEYNPTF